jgi:hypothetical protein
VNQTPITSVPRSPTPTAGPGGQASHGVAFFVLAVVVVGALLISVWRLRRKVSGPET